MIVLRKGYEEIGYVVEKDRSDSIVHRSFTADFLNEVVNEPSVYRWVHGRYEGRLDLSVIVQNHSNVLLMGKHGGILFAQHQPGLYEAHTQVLPEGRGQWTLDMTNAALKWMFTRTDAVEIFSKVPKGNLGARALVKAIKGTFEFKVDNGWVVDGEIVPADIFSLTLQNWVRTAPGLERRGEWFNTRLIAEYKKLGNRNFKYTENPIRDRYMGCAIDTIMGGQEHKAVIFYNRWARMSGYGDIRVVTDSPLVIDIQDALLMIRDNDFWVMTCQQPPS